MMKEINLKSQKYSKKIKRRTEALVFLILSGLRLAELIAANEREGDGQKKE